MAAPMVMEQLTLVCSDGTQFKVIVNSGEACKLRTDAEYAAQCLSRLQQLCPDAGKSSEQAVAVDQIKPIVEANSSPKEHSMPPETSPEDDNDIDAENATQCVSVLQQPSEQAVEADANKETCHSVPQETSNEGDKDIDAEYAAQCVSMLQQPSEPAVEADANKETCHSVPQETSSKDDDDIGKNSFGSAAKVAKAETIYRCGICDDIYSSKWYLQRHLHAIHKQPNFIKERPKNNDCDCACASWRDLERHCANIHVLRLAKETLSFSSEKEFIKWKEEIEKESATHFVKKKKTIQKTNGEVVENFYCHLSGEFHTRDTGVRLLKNNGSNKIGATCPSRIRATKKHNRSVEVIYFKSHIGHTANVHRLPVTEEERQSVGVKPAQNIPVKEIVNSVRNSTSPGRIERIHLLTRKYTLNEKDEYRSNPLNQVRRENDAGSVSTSIEIGSHTPSLNNKELTVPADGAGSNTTCTVMPETSVGETFAQGNANQDRRANMMHEFEDTNKTFKELVKNINTNEELANLHKMHANYKAQLERCLTQSKTATLFSGGKNNPKKTRSTKHNNNKKQQIKRN